METPDQNQLTSLLSLMNQTREEQPLIHCITNPISIHDCANVILAVGGRPIMAEHPQEVSEITAQAQALACNLGNITDVRMDSMQRAIQTANTHQIPVMLDLVGVACSHLRLDFARKLLSEHTFTLIKGNSSELRAITNLESHSSGIDAGFQDSITQENLPQIAPVFSKLSAQTGAALLATGPTDLIWHKKQAWLGVNGTPMLSRITGTGCMLGMLAATYLPAHKPLEAALLATSVMGIAGELAEHAQGHGSFAVELLDRISLMTEEQLSSNIRMQRVL